MPYIQAAIALRRCTAIKLNGERCRGWATWNGEGQRCAPHSGRKRRRHPPGCYPDHKTRYWPCHCEAYQWPHRPGGQLCRWPDDPREICSIPASTHSSPRWSKLRSMGLGQWGWMVQFRHGKYARKPAAASKQAKVANVAPKKETPKHVSSDQKPSPSRVIAPPFAVSTPALARPRANQPEPFKSKSRQQDFISEMPPAAFSFWQIPSSIPRAPPLFERGRLIIGSYVTLKNPKSLSKSWPALISRSA